MKDFTLKEISTIRIALESKYDFFKKYFENDCKIGTQIYSKEIDFVLGQIDIIEGIFAKLEEIEIDLIRSNGVIMKTYKNCDFNEKGFCKYLNKDVGYYCNCPEWKSSQLIKDIKEF